LDRREGGDLDLISLSAMRDSIKLGGRSDFSDFAAKFDRNVTDISEDEHVDRKSFAEQALFVNNRSVVYLVKPFVVQSVENLL